MKHRVISIALICCCSLLLVVCCFSTVLLIRSQKELSDTKYTLDQLESRFAGYKTSYKELEKRHDELLLKNDEKLTNALNFYDNYIVIVPYSSNGKTDTHYHQYGCFDSILSGGKFEVYTLNGAKQAGYKPCDCIDPYEVESYLE